MDDRFFEYGDGVVDMDGGARVTDLRVLDTSHVIPMEHIVHQFGNEFEKMVLSLVPAPKLVPISGMQVFDHVDATQIQLGKDVSKGLDDVRDLMEIGRAHV